jgi:hypothetical protein
MLAPLLHARLPSTTPCTASVDLLHVDTFPAKLWPADSDIDLGLFGYMHNVELEGITPAQAKKLLYSVLSGVNRAMLAQGNKVCWGVLRRAVSQLGPVACTPQH